MRMTTINRNIHATAPYNFAPLPDQLITLDIDRWEQNPDSEKQGLGYPQKNAYLSDRFTGSMDIVLSPLTEIYIRNGLSKEIAKLYQEIFNIMENSGEKSPSKWSLVEWQDKANNLRDDNPLKFKIRKYICHVASFFSPGGRVRIPGSSLRGMIRTLVEAMTASKPTKIDDDRFFWRHLATRHPDEGKYKDLLMVQGQGSTNPAGPKASGGYIIKKESKYYMIPAYPGGEPVEHDAKGHQRWNENVSVFAGVSGMLNNNLYEMRAINPVNNKYIPNPDYKWDRYLVWFSRCNPTRNNHTRIVRGNVRNYNIYYALVSDQKIRQITNPSGNNGWELGWLVCCGWMPGGTRGRGKHIHWIVPIPDNNLDNMNWDKTLQIPQLSIDLYKKDCELSNVNKMDFSVLPEKQEKSLNKYLDGISDDVLSPMKKEYVLKLGVPCFYVENTTYDRQVQVFFGHTPYFRIPYKHALNEYIPEDFLDPEKMDLATLMFGTEGDEKKDPFATRIFFEDFFTEEPIEAENEEIKIPQILGSPKPTCFAHYLEQPDAIPKMNNDNTIAHDRDQNPLVDLNEIKTYNTDTDSNTQIRGIKFYWHKQNPDPYAQPTESFSQYTLISPIKPQKFRSRIRFENLTALELGALLTAIQLPEGCAHKLGMGKPRGLGSIRININSLRLRTPFPQTPVSDTELPAGRYTSLFNSNNGAVIWHTGEKEVREHISEFQSYFQQEYMKRLSPESRNQSNNEYWDTYCMRELKKILTCNVATTNEEQKRIQYYPLNKHANHYPLPLPTNVFPDNENNGGYEMIPNPRWDQLPSEQSGSEENTSSKTSKGQTRQKKTSHTVQTGLYQEYPSQDMTLECKETSKNNVTFCCLEHQVDVKIPIDQAKKLFRAYIFSKGKQFTQKGKLIPGDSSASFYRLEPTSSH